MADVFPSCSTPSQIEFSKPTADTLNAKWFGNATTFKFRYKLESASSWTEATMAAGGSSGGSGYFTAINPAQVNPGSFSIIQADFTTGTLSPGVYDVEVVNICIDGSEYKSRFKILMVGECGEIPNLRLANKSDSQIRVEWDEYEYEGSEIVTDEYMVVWCETDQFGNVIDCDYDVTEELFYILPFPPASRYKFTVLKKCGDWGSAKSDVLNLFLCKCGGSGDITNISSGAAFTHVQAVAASTWGPINHALGFFPNVTAVDNSGNEISGVAEYIDADHLQIVFSRAVAGFAYLS